ncbi:hypothetical protein ACQPXS_35635 [Streptomyces sp. CA-142005]|uniref:hypothetical protein n=1 Tax=Streptomyces sp. CA-142005 TaxID=3240052 RepID=UPI003D90DB03
MIGPRIAVRTAWPSGRAGQLLGLVLLITVHLAGHTHGAAFEGRHVDVAGVKRAHDTDVDTGEALAGTPGHHHHHHPGAHIDHAVDRPRAVSADATDSAPVPDAVAAIPVTVPAPVRVGTTRDPPPGPRSAYGRSALALHCVWRQ